MKRVALFIDGANLYATTKALGMTIDFSRLLSYFSKDRDMVRAFYYTALIDSDEHSTIRPLIDWLDYNDFCVVSKTAKEFINHLGQKKIKGNMDIELAVDALELAPKLDHMVLMSGDGDFRYLVEAVQRKGVHVTAVSTIATQPAMIADELRRQVDRFIDFDTIRQYICRDGKSKLFERRV